MKRPIFVVIALVLGAMTAFIAARMMSGPQASGPSVVIVEQPIDAGKPILGEQIKAISWSGSVVPVIFILVSSLRVCTLYMGTLSRCLE
ncbi:hypothetical protein NY406_01700 [Chlorobaculum sp. MV4-Y]|uniref:hypothetical protein n=1 Tax=Chlorobaculum sp. MV4-Y TaxID=2976335 RepID=UPI0021B00DFE|nr:hypothetical protein [Chlorobaculum sp. MV4-Y]UWX58011.1 hypothetical protein NY406_01700 [Chlorobaculum sp. MV4-Y]